MQYNFYYEGEDAEKLKNELEKNYGEVKEYFDFDLDEFSIYVYKTRKEYEDALNKKTEPWNTATSWPTGKIYILNPDAFEKESSHSRDEFSITLKHEIVHLFTAKLSQKNSAPRWLKEGVAYYIAKQYDKAFNSNYYIEENFCEKLATPRGWKMFLDFNAYGISALFVYYLIETYSFDKIKELFTSLDQNFYYPFFEKKFESVFGKAIKDTERDFVEHINC